jgi:hypothetical protein
MLTVGHILCGRRLGVALHDNVMSREIASGPICAHGHFDRLLRRDGADTTLSPSPFARAPLNIVAS